VTRSHREAGSVLPLIALSLSALLGFAGVGVDVGYLEFRQQAQQAATDAAAVGGAQALVRSGCNDQSAAQTAADSDSAGNGFTNGGNTTVTVQNPPTSGPFASNECAVYVQITTTRVATFFSRFFGYSTGMNESTQAVAAVTAANPAACIYLLSSTTEANFNGANVASPGCSIAINDTANFNGATISAPFIGYAGASPNENGATFKVATPAPMLPVADPCGEISGCSYLASNAPSASGCVNFNGNGYTGTIYPECYDSLNLNGATVTMSPGTYVFNGSSNFNDAKVVGNGITIYVTSSGSAPNFNGATVTFAPPTPGPSQSSAGVLYYQVPSNTGNPNFNGDNNTYSGLIYCPGATAVNFNGANGGYVVLVFGSTNFNGSSAVDFATPPPDDALVKQVVLAE
jgi:hypothetical protein